jgi:hypothetical protein
MGRGLRGSRLMIGARRGSARPSAPADLEPRALPAPAND